MGWKLLLDISHWGQDERRVIHTLNLSLLHPSLQEGGSHWDISLAEGRDPDLSPGMGQPQQEVSVRVVPWQEGAVAACPPSQVYWREGQALWVPTWFLACLYRVCFKASESRAELSTSLTSNASSAALRRSSPFPKVGVGSKAKRPPPRSSTHLHQGPGRRAWGQLSARRPPH